MDIAEQLKEAVRRRDEIKREVLDWMDDEAKQFRIRTNSQAPMWHSYEEAENSVSRLTREFAKT